MSKFRVYQISGLNLRVSPLLQKEGELLRSVNVDSSPFGARVKRPGYTSYLGTANGGAINTLFNFTLDNGTQFWNYANFGGTLHYSTQGTGAWTVCGGGTLTAGNAPIGYAVQKNTLIIGDGTAATRHSTDGTSFTNTSAAPVGQYLSTYQNRVFIGGTGSVLTYSVTNDATNWSTTGTSDSSSLNIPGAGKINQVFTANDRIVVNKTAQTMFRWDGFSLVQIPTTKGLSSPQSLSSMEDFWFYLNNDGFYGYNGDRPQLLSMPITRQIYNDIGKGVQGTTFSNSPGVTHKYKYFAQVGTVTDDFSLGTVANCTEVYDYINNEWSNYSFADRPSCWLSYRDASGSQQLIFASGSQAYTYGNSALNDNGNTIEAVMEGVLHFGAPESDKEYKYMWAFFNPGCEAKIQVAMADTYTTAKKVWIDLQDVNDGVKEMRFPMGARSKFLFWRVYEASRNNRFDFYGMSFEMNIVDRK